VCLFEPQSNSSSSGSWRHVRLSLHLDNGGFCLGRLDNAGSVVLTQSAKHDVLNMLRTRHVA